MGAEDGGVLAPNQFTAAKCFSELFGWLMGDFFYIGKKKCISAQMFLSALNICFTNGNVSIAATKQTFALGWEG